MSFYGYYNYSYNNYKNYGYDSSYYAFNYDMANVAYATTSVVTSLYLISVIVPIVLIGTCLICIFVGWCCCCKAKRIDSDIKAKKRQAKNKLREKITRLEHQGGTHNNTALHGTVLDHSKMGIVDYEHGAKHTNK